jgi:hypothetical protein
VLFKLVDGALVLVAGNPELPVAGVVKPIGYPGTPGTADGQGRDAAFASPTGLAIHADGNLYVAERDVIRKVTPAGNVTTVAGQRGVSTLMAGPLPGGLGRLSSLAIGPDGVLHAAVQPAGTFAPDLSLVKIKLP